MSRPRTNFCRVLNTLLFYVLILQIQSPEVHAVRQWYNSSRCPEWLNHYIEFHTANKGAPDAKYLGYMCSSTGSDCLFGLGDRLRGIEMMVRAAVASKRILLVDVPFPIPFSTLFAPSALDWRMGDMEVPQDAVWWRGEQRLGLLQSNAALDDPSKFIAVEGHNQIHILPIKNAPDMDWVGLAAHCTFRALFRPSQQVLKAIAVRQSELGLPFPKRYVAVHIRLQGLGVQGEAGKAYHSIELKNLILEGSLKNTTTTKILPLMRAAAGGEDESPTSEAQLINTVADMGILSGSACLVAEYASGFSTQARLWGSPSLWAKTSACFRGTMECIKEGGGGDRAGNGNSTFTKSTNTTSKSTNTTSNGTRVKSLGF